MVDHSGGLLDPLRRARWLLLVAALSLGGCATHYIDGNTKEILAADYKKPVELKPVQLLFEFQSKGVINARATELFKARVSEQVKTSGLFASVDSTPVPGGALISVAINNVPLTDDAFTRGFVTGFTFGLAGNQLTDGYVCTVTYLDGRQSQPIVKMARHALHTTVGAAAAPPNSTKADNISTALTTIMRQVVSQALNDLSQDRAFQ